MSDDSCPVTGLTGGERKLINETWAKLKGTTSEHYETAGIHFVIWMFDTMADMRSLFKSFEAHKVSKSSTSDPKFVAHTKKVMDTLDSLVNILEEPRKVKELVGLLAETHLMQSPPVGASYFEKLSDEFHHFLSTELKVPQDHPGVQAFSKLMQRLAAVVKYREEKAAKTSFESTAAPANSNTSQP